jgi:hypothetical protein
MSQYVFGTGQLFAMPVGGGAPLRFGALQDVSVDFSGDVKTLYGQYQFPLDNARGKTKIEWKASSANIDITAFNTLFFGQSVAADDELIQVINEPGLIPASVAYTVTVTNAANFAMDLGVTYAATGLPLKQVAAAPTTGEYTVSAEGVYTFVVGDEGKAVLITYLYESSSTGGTLDLTNQLMGNTPKFQLVLSQNYNGQTFTLILYSCITDKLSMPLKMDDYLMAEMSGSANADSQNRIARITTTSITGGGL